MSDAKPLTPEEEREFRVRQYILHDPTAYGPNPAVQILKDEARIWATLDAERARAERAEAALAACEADYAEMTRVLAKLERKELIGCENEEGEDYIECSRCDAQDWGSLDVYDSGEMDHAKDCPFAILSSPHARRVLEARDE